MSQSVAVTLEAPPLRGLLRIEGLVELVLAGAAYAVWDGRWWLFAVLFLAPDLAMLGYLLGARTGAACYNIVHMTVGPALLGVVAFAGHWPLGVSLALIWFAHVQFDRALGYGLKSGRGFRFTHLGLIGHSD
jgi:hypothetical protein